MRCVAGPLRSLLPLFPNTGQKGINAKVRQEVAMYQSDYDRIWYAKCERNRRPPSSSSSSEGLTQSEIDDMIEEAHEEIRLRRIEEYETSVRKRRSFHNLPRTKIGDRRSSWSMRTRSFSIGWRFCVSTSSALTDYGCQGVSLPAVELDLDRPDIKKPGPERRSILRIFRYRNEKRHFAIH